MVITRRLTARQLTFILAIVVGLAAGGMTCVFEWLLEVIKSGLTSWFKVDNVGWLYLIYPAVGIVLTTLFVKYIVKDDISEGVAKVLKAMSTDSSRIKPHNSYSSVVAGALTIGFGGSVGPEAPIVLTGGAIGSNIGRIMRLNYRNTTLMLACGVAAALSAIFKAPITGVIFVLEVLMLDISMTAIIPLIISSVTAVLLVFFVRGFEPLLSVDLVGVFKLSHLPVYAVMAVASGLVSYYFTKMNFSIKARYARLKTEWQRWIVGGLTIGILVFLFPPLYGEGYSAFGNLMTGSVDFIFNNSLLYDFRNIEWVVVLYMVVLMLIKVVATAATTSAGGVGGTFAPSLFVGAFVGATIAYICNTWLGMHLSIAACSLVGMAGIMSGVMKAPLTSVFLIAEISNGYQLFVPLMLVSCISFVIDRYFEPDSIYTKQLRKKGQLLTHDKDQAISVILSIKPLIETDFTPVSDSDTGRYGGSHHSHTAEPLSGGRRQGKVPGRHSLRCARKDISITKVSNSVKRYINRRPTPPCESLRACFEKFENTRLRVNLPVVDRDGLRRFISNQSLILGGYVSNSRDVAGLTVAHNDPRAIEKITVMSALHYSLFAADWPHYRNPCTALSRRGVRCLNRGTSRSNIRAFCSPARSNFARVHPPTICRYAVRSTP